MKRTMVGCAVAILVAGASAFAETTSVTGELVTMMCYTGHGEDGRGEKHVACATKCAREGYPLAVLTDDGSLYKVTGNLADDRNAKLQELISKRVVATGEVGDEGRGKTIDATSVTAEK